VPRKAHGFPSYDKANPRAWFLEICDVLINEVQEELNLFDLPQYERDWVKTMLDYNCKGGKLNRGLMVVESARELFKHKGLEVTDVEMARFAVLGWCIEWMQAWLLIADDMMDASETRRGQPCWYKLPHVKDIAINDAVCLETLVFKMLKRHFGHEDYYTQLVDLFMETTWETEVGQMLDTLCVHTDLKEFSVHRWTQIVKYKTAFYSFYCPVALGMIVAGVTDRSAYDTARDILVEMGVYFQAQDDFLDCFADPSVLGKIGTDIQDKKCGWLFVHAYNELVNADQKLLLDRLYGNCTVGSPEEASIKALYTDLGLEDLYRAYEKESYDKIMRMRPTVESSQVLPWSIFEAFLAKVYKRSK
jgi:farnesyl diphosphate synthase